MKFKNPVIDIPIDDPFKNDMLNRLQSAVALHNLFNKIQEPMVLAIDSEWGTGKTTFVQMFKKYLENNKFNCLYFNAWENDIAPDPLISFISEFEDNIENKKCDDTTKTLLKKAVDNVKDLSKKIIKNAIPASLKLATCGLIDLDKTTEDEIAKIVENIAKDEIDKYKNQKKSIKHFKNSLKEFVDILRQNNNTPLCIFVDELDRCRPNYAIELLEKIKHLFNIEGIIFILSIDREQICNSIKTLYGINMNVEGYLRRFIDIYFTLHKPSILEVSKVMFERYCFDEYFNERSKNHELSGDKNEFINFFSIMADVFNLTIRDTEHCFTMTAISLSNTNVDHFIYPLLLAFFISLKISNPIVYYSFINKKINAIDLLNYIKEIDKTNKIFSDNYGIALEIHLKLSQFKIVEITKQYNDIITNDKAKEEEKKYAEIALTIISWMRTRSHHSVIKYILNKIEITSNFDKQDF